MAQNTIMINFNPCEPTPLQGFIVRYRPTGSVEEYRPAPGSFFVSPITFQDELDPIGTSYEGFIQGDCGDGMLGVPVAWDAPNSASGGGESGGSGSGSSEAPVACRTYVLTKTVGSPSAHFIDCLGVTHDTSINDHTTICTNGHGFTISGGGITVNSFVDGPCT